MRIPRLLFGAVVVMAAVAATTPSADASILYRRMADVNLEVYATRAPGDDHIRMAPYVDDESQSWTIVTGYASLITVVLPAWPEEGCWSVDLEDGGEGAPLLYKTSCVAGNRAQDWRMTAYPDGVMLRNLHVDHNHRCAGFLPEDPDRLVRELTCDEDDLNQRFALPPLD